jgi:hypothetical protein
MRTKITKLILLTTTLFGPGLAYAGACGDTVRDIQNGDYAKAADDAVGCLHDIHDATSDGGGGGGGGGGHEKP